MTVDCIEKLIGSVDNVTLLGSFSTNADNRSISGKIAITLSDKSVSWDVKIDQVYPYKICGHESIRFINEDLISYPHIMQGGVLCMHPAEYEDAECQFINDLMQLREWVDTYYIRGVKDDHYEHLVVNTAPICGEYYTYCFSETDVSFLAEDYGKVVFAPIQRGYKRGKDINNFVVQSFLSDKYRRREMTSMISSAYHSTKDSSMGFYCFLKEAPSIHGKFIIEDYSSLDDLFSQAQKDALYGFVQKYRNKMSNFPLFCGYKIPGGEIHWHVALVYLKELPIECFSLGSGQGRSWHTRFKQGTILWGHTENISYKYFFGRGAMPNVLADKKILIMGIGAIGSMVAETWTRCGGKYVTLHDIDTKEPGNVCRSTYPFLSGITEKTYDLERQLVSISPHVNSSTWKDWGDLLIKLHATGHGDNQSITEIFDDFDIIFDCTTDNQLMRIMDTIPTSAQVVNLSITNHAQDLVCALSPNVTETVSLVFRQLNRPKEFDMYNPTGCWNPTFKASYNDIASKVQFALKHIISMLSNQEPKSNFFITEEEESLKMHRL
jgi:thiF family protein